MALTPEEIERRQFPVVSTGYDRDQVDHFLEDAAMALRRALRGERDTVVPEAPPQSARRTAGGGSFDRLGDEVADILRSAEQLADSLRAAAEAEAADVKSDAERSVAEALETAERERDQAKRVLVRAQERAEAILAEAEEQARARLERADAEADERAAQLLARSRRHAEQVLRAERAAVDRLRAVRADIEAAITRLAGSETTPVVDLTSGQAVVRVGEVPGLDDELRREPDERAALAGQGREAGPSDDDPGFDPVQRLIRAAVSRAAAHPVVGLDPTEDESDEPDEPGRAEAAGAPHATLP